MPILSVGSGSLDSRFNAALTKLRAIYKHGYKLYQGTKLDEIAMVDMTSREALLQLALLIDGSGYSIRPLKADTVYGENPPKIMSQCGYSRMDLWAIQWGLLEDDLTRMMTIQSMPEMAGKPVQAPLLEILKMLKANPVCLYDDLAFFHASHKVDPYGDPANVAPNLITQPLTSAGWNNFLQQVISRPDPGSDASKDRLYMPNRDLNGSNLTIWCGTTSIFSALDKIFDPRSLWEGSNATESRKVYAQASVQLVPEMGIDSSNYTNYCYVLVNNTPNRGVMARIPHAAKIDETRDGSDVEVNNKVKHVNAYQTWGCTTGFPFALYKWLFS